MKQRCASSSGGAGVGWSWVAPDRPTLRGIVVGPRRSGYVQAQLAELQAQSLPGDAEQEGGPELVPARVLQDAREQEPIQLPVGLLVQVAGVGAKVLADERLRVEVSPQG